MLKKTFTYLTVLTAISAHVYSAPSNQTPATSNLQIPAPSEQVAQKPAQQQNAATSVTILSPRMREALIDQVSKEQYSSNLYLTFASYFGDLGLDGCEAFFRNSSKEEAEHALLFFNQLIDRGEKFQMKQVNASALMPTSPLDAFTKLLENEIQVTRSIHNLYKIALEENDYASQVFLHDFIALQVQEEKEATDLLDLISSGPTDPAFILLFDNKLAEKVEQD
jgi:ferritin